MAGTLHTVALLILVMTITKNSRGDFKACRKFQKAGLRKENL